MTAIFLGGEGGCRVSKRRPSQIFDQWRCERKTNKHNKWADFGFHIVRLPTEASGRLCVQNMRLITDNQPQEKHIDLSVDHNDIKKKCNTAIKAPET